MKKTKLIMPLIFLCLLIMAILPMTVFAEETYPTEEPVVEEVVEPKEEEPKVEEPVVEEPKVEAPVVEEPQEEPQPSLVQAPAVEEQEEEQEEEFAEEQLTLTLSKAPKYYEPSFNEGLVYNGSAQDLIKAGNAKPGTYHDYKYMYSIKIKGQWTKYSDSVPQATNAGTYKVKWKLFKATKGHQNWEEYGDSTSETVTIAKAKITVTTEPAARYLNIALGKQDLITAGEATTATGATVTFKYRIAKKGKADSFTTDIPQDSPKKESKYYVEWEADVEEEEGIDNYEVEEGGVFVGATYLLPTAETGLIYNAHRQFLLDKKGGAWGFFEKEEIQYQIVSRNGLSIVGSQWKDDIKGIYAKNWGTYEVRVRVAKWEYKHHDWVITDSVTLGTVEITISKKAVTVQIAPKEITYGDDDVALTVVPQPLCHDDELKADDITLVREQGTDVKYDEAGEVTGYEISAVGIREGAELYLDNYEFTYENALYIINPYDITFDGVVTLGKPLHFNGEEQTQEIASVVAGDGKFNLSEKDYTVTNATKTTAGSYIMHVNGKGNFTGSVDKWYVIVGKDIDVKDLEGKVKVETKADEKVQKIELASSLSDTVKAAATAEELSRVAAGESMNIWLNVADAKDSIDKETKAAIEKAADGKTILGFFDITLMAQVGEDDAHAISKTNKPITITIKLTDDQLNKNPAKERTYSIVKYHDGKATVIEGVFDADKKTVTFTSDEFSVYALQYVDVDVKVAPKTADTNNTSLYIYMSIAAIAALAWFGMSLRKER